MFNGSGANTCSPAVSWSTQVRALIFLAVVLVGLLVVAAGGLLSRAAGQRASPEGWTVVRPPAEAAAIEFVGQTVWVGGMEGLWVLDGDSGHVLHAVRRDGGAAFRFVRAIVVTEDGVWVGHRDGLSLCTTEPSCRTLTTANGLPHDTVMSLSTGPSGEPWVGTWEGAAVRTTIGWQSLRESDGLLVDMVNTVMADSRGGTWFGSYVAPRGGLAYLRDGAWQYFTTDNGLPHNNVNASIEMSDGTVWVGTGMLDRGGAVRLAQSPRDEWEIADVLSRDDGLPGAKVRSLYEDRTGRLWVGTEYDGLACVEHPGAVGYPRVVAVYTTDDGLSGNEIKIMREDAEGNAWLGTDAGLTIIKAEEFGNLCGH